jgi:hypothetical protein
MKNLVIRIYRSPLLVFLLTMLALGILTAVGPQEQTLGVYARIVYLHGVWVWASLAAFVAAGAVGLLGLLARRDTLNRWSRALGRTGLFFWITYLPISMWAMQTSWNGLFLAEPRFRMALIFAITGLLLQMGLTLLENPAWASAVNLVYVIVLFLVLGNTQNVMHPPSPIINSDAPRIQAFFALMFALMLLAAWQVARWWHNLETPADKAFQPARARTLRR